MKIKMKIIVIFIKNKGIYKIDVSCIVKAYNSFFNLEDNNKEIKNIVNVDKSIVTCLFYIKVYFNK